MNRRDFGNVRRLPSGRHQARYVDRNGRSQVRTFETKRQAAEHLAEARADLSRGRWQDPTIARRRFGEYAEEWLAGRVDLKPTTRQQYAGTLRRHVQPHLGGYALEELTSARVRSWYAALARSTSVTPTRQAYAFVRTILNTAVDDEILLRNPCRSPPFATPARPRTGAPQDLRVGTMADGRAPATTTASAAAKRVPLRTAVG